jgi:hypothetical protein
MSAVSGVPTPNTADISGHLVRGSFMQLRIEEYARHCGHADLLRECIDGRVGQ